MTGLVVQNIVATGNIGRSVNFADIMESIDLPYVRYDPDIHQGLEIRFIEDGPLITVYATGKYIIRAPSREMLNETREEFLSLLFDIGILDEPENVSFDINNVVASGTIGREVDLDALNPDLSLGEVEYNPSEFPALQCRLSEYNTTVLLYRSGNVIITGASSLEEGQAAYKEFTSELQGLFDTSP